MKTEILNLDETLILDDATANVAPIQMGSKDLGEGSSYAQIGAYYQLGLCPYQDNVKSRQLGAEPSNYDRDNVAMINREDLDRVLANLGA